MSRETSKTTPPLPTVPIGTKVMTQGGFIAEITLVRARKYAKRYQITYSDGQRKYVRREEFQPS
jgi:preprotein translocase subunit YajC